MDTQEALRIVESVLNEYRGIKRLAEILEPVLGAEVRLAELEQEKKRLEDKVMVEQVKLNDLFVAVKAAEAAIVRSMDAEFKGVAEIKAAAEVELSIVNKEITASNADLAVVKGIVAAAKSTGEAEVAAIGAEANAQQRRLDKITKKIAEAKAL